MYYIVSPGAQAAIKGSKFNLSRVSAYERLTIVKTGYDISTRGPFADHTCSIPPL